MARPPRRGAKAVHKVESLGQTVPMERITPEVAAAASAKPVQVGGRQLTIENVVDVAAGRCAGGWNRDPAVVGRIERGAALLRRRPAENAPATGGTPGN